MRIAYYMPFKPMGHANPSGDLMIGTELYHLLQQQVEKITLVSRLRTRWIYWKPWQMASLPIHLATACRQARRIDANLWVSYHSYYKAPDLLGPICARYLGIPYVIFQGIYATKYRRRMATMPGFWLNRWTLLSAKLVFSNKHRDHRNLKRLIASERLIHVAPGIVTSRFVPCPKARAGLREQWNARRKPVIITAAMFRPGVKSLGIRQVIHACHLLKQNGSDFLLLIIGDGETRGTLMQLAQETLPQRHIFLGKVARDQLQRYFSAADLFVFPGIEESLGMVYLEAQCCGLPVVALKKWGASEAVLPNRTGILVQEEGIHSLAQAMAKLLNNADLRMKMGRAARQHVLQHHDLAHNYGRVVRALEELTHLPQ